MRRWVAPLASENRLRTCRLLPVPDVAPDGARPRRLTDSLPAVLRPSRSVEAERIGFTARDGLRIEGNPIGHRP